MCSAALASPVFGEGEDRARITPGIYEICAVTDTGFVVDVETCVTKDAENETEHVESSQNVQMFRSLDVNQQKFYIEQLPNDRYRISALNSGEALSVNETEVYLDTLQRSAGSAAAKEQTWYLESAGDGTYYIVSEEEIPAAMDELLTDDGILETIAASSTEEITDDNNETANANSTNASVNETGEVLVPGYLSWQDTTLYNGTGLCLDHFSGTVKQKWILKKTWISEQDTAHTDFVNPFDEYGPYANVCLMLKFGKEKEVLTSEDLAAWVLEEEHTSKLSADVLLAYAQKLADKYDTQGHARKFMTSYGKEITLYKGNFGWKLDVEKTAEAIKEAACYHRQRYVAPVWSHEGVGFIRGNDIGNSYVEIDLVNQKVWLYKDGEQLLATECVSGTYGTDRQTPGGVYSITYKQSPAVLRGADYESPVTYWMPFNGGIGLHDANWRSAFGGNIFRTDGSHGCVNLPTWAAAIIYEETYIGYPVVCYN